MSAGLEWRGLVNAILYGIDLTGPVDETLAGQRAEALIAQRVFTDRVDDYYQAAQAALASGVRLGYAPGEDAPARAFLDRLIAELDARRPWPEPPFRQLDPAGWTALREAPVVARLQLSRMQVQERLNRLFDKEPPDGSAWPILLLQLRTGETVALQAPGGYTEPGVAVRAHSSAPAQLLREFAQLTGIRNDEITPA